MQEPTQKGTEMMADAGWFFKNTEMMNAVDISKMRWHSVASEGVK